MESLRIPNLNIRLDDDAIAPVIPYAKIIKKRGPKFAIEDVLKFVPSYSAIDVKDEDEGENVDNPKSRPPSVATKNPVSHAPENNYDLADPFIDDSELLEDEQPSITMMGQPMETQTSNVITPSKNDPLVTIVEPKDYKGFFAFRGNRLETVQLTKSLREFLDEEICNISDDEIPLSNNKGKRRAILDSSSEDEEGPDGAESEIAVTPSHEKKPLISDFDHTIAFDHRWSLGQALTSDNASTNLDSQQQQQQPKKRSRTPNTTGGSEKRQTKKKKPVVAPTVVSNGAAQVEQPIVATPIVETTDPIAASDIKPVSPLAPETVQTSHQSTNIVPSKKKNTAEIVAQDLNDENQFILDELKSTGLVVEQPCKKFPSAWKNHLIAFCKNRIIFKLGIPDKSPELLSMEDFHDFSLITTFQAGSLLKLVQKSLLPDIIKQNLERQSSLEVELKAFISEAIAQTSAKTAPQGNDDKKEKVKWDERLKRTCFEWIQNELELRYMEEYLRVLKMMEGENPPVSSPWSIKNVVEVRREISQQVASFGNNSSLWIWQDISREYNSFRRRKRKPIEFITKSKPSS